MGQYAERREKRQDRNSNGSRQKKKRGENKVKSNDGRGGGGIELFCVHLIKIRSAISFVVVVFIKKLINKKKQAISCACDPRYCDFVDPNMTKTRYKY